VSWIAVFRKDFRDAIRSRTLWITIGVFVLFAGLVTFGYTDYFASGLDEQTPRLVTYGLVWVLSGRLIPGVGPVPLLVPLIGLLLGHKAIVGEREGGQLKFLLGLPHSRLEVVVGKLLGRSTVALVALVAGFLISALLLVRSGGLEFGPFVALVVVTALFAVVHVAVGIGVSAGVSSSTVATVLVVAFFAVFQIAWNGIFQIVQFLVLQPDSPSPDWTPPDWFRLLRSLSPANAYNAGLEAALELVGTIPEQLRAIGGEPPTTGPEPVYLADWFGVVVLVLWVVVPLAAGYVVFQRADLG
jgi:ABC-2 type transport system permease protein